MKRSSSVTTSLSGYNILKLAEPRSKVDEHNVICVAKMGANHGAHLK